MKSSKQVARRQSEKAYSHTDIKNKLAIKLSEMNALHETIFAEQNRLLQENKELMEELCVMKEENLQTLTTKNKVIHVNG